MRFLLIIALLLSCSARSATYTASSPSWADVSNALASCSAAGGDTLAIPAGAANWTNTLIIDRGVSIIGAGTNSTAITNGAIWPFWPPFGTSLHPPLFWIKTTNDVLVRISSIQAVCNGTGITNLGSSTNGNQFIYADPLNRSSSLVYSKVVIDRNWVRDAYSRAIYTAGPVNALVYSNLFDDCFLIIEPTDGNGKGWTNRSWSTPPMYGLGTTNVIICEDNLVHYGTPTMLRDPGPAPTASGQGGSYVWRFNVISNSVNQRQEGHDMHGNNHLESYDGWRGTVFGEVYGNKTYTPTGNKGSRYCWWRGGTIMMYSNILIWNGYTNTTADDLEYGEEEYNASMAVYDYPAGLVARTNPPAQDQLTNCYWWANWTSSSNPFTLYPRPTESTNFILINRDIFTNAPWDTNYTFVNYAGATNVMASYRPLAYPHPLRSLFDSSGSSPAAAALNAAVANIGQIVYVGP